MKSVIRIINTRLGRREWAALLCSLALIVLSILLARHVGAFEQFGYIGSFLAMLIGSATVFLPAPALAVVVALGATVANPWLVGLAGGLGATIGEITGYLAGYSGHKIVEEQPQYKNIAGLLEKHGYWAIMLLAFVPNPLFDVAGVIAGSTKYPLSKFLTATLIGKVAKCLAAAYVGVWSFGWLI